VIANMGAELGATTTVFPSDETVRSFLRSQQRADAWSKLVADEGATYDLEDEIDLSSLEPLIACPTSPGNVVPVGEVAGREIYQAYIGSSANPGLRDFAVPALMLEGRHVHPRVSFDVNPTSRQILENLITMGSLEKLVHAGARLHQAGCNGCIGMGQAPASGRISVRTVPRNFPGRSGTKEDQVYLASPETATASALTGVITDPRTLSMKYPRFVEPDTIRINTEMLEAPAAAGEPVDIEKGPNIKALPQFEALPERIAGVVLLRVGNDISTDEILPAGAKVLPFRSNIPEISKFAFAPIDETFYARAMEHRERGFFVVGGTNYGQGSSREHAAIAPRFLGLRAVIATSFARIHWQNLVNFGVVPLTFVDASYYARIEQGDELEIDGLRKGLAPGRGLVVRNLTRKASIEVAHALSARRRPHQPRSWQGRRRFRRKDALGSSLIRPCGASPDAAPASLEGSAWRARAHVSLRPSVLFPLG
jgi:aconitate hydratase